jgi:hypothetical protein
VKGQHVGHAKDNADLFSVRRKFSCHQGVLSILS